MNRVSNNIKRGTLNLKYFLNYIIYKLIPILLFVYGLAITTDDIYYNNWAVIIGIRFMNMSNAV